MMHITTLAENLTYQAGLIAEHGLSVLVEIHDKKILFDTGQGKALMHNARQLHIDLGEIDNVVISHGHYDHTGGLEDFLQVNSKANIYIKEEAFADKLKGATRQIGMMNSSGKTHKKIHMVKRPCEIEKGVFVMPDIPIQHHADTGFYGFITDTGNGMKTDEFDDEVYLAIVSEKNLSVTSGCSHRGISNILLAAIDCFKKPVRMVLGGFHLIDCTEEQYLTVRDVLKQVDPELIGVCHCTGVDKYCELRRDLGGKVFYNYCGNNFVIKE